LAAICAKNYGFVKLPQKKYNWHVKYDMRPKFNKKTAKKYQSGLGQGWGEE